MGKRWCDVTAQTANGKRHTITVQADSVYDAALQFEGRAKTGFPCADLPKMDRDTVFEVRPVYRVAYAKLIAWANSKANLYARSRRYRKRR